MVSNASSIEDVSAVKQLKRLAGQLSSNHLYRTRLYKLLATYTNPRDQVQLTSVFENQMRKKQQQGDKRGEKVFTYLTTLTRQANLSPLEALAVLLPKDEVAIIEAHPSENMQQGFKRAAFLTAKKNDIRAAFTSGMMMPIMALTIGLITTYYQLSNQVPNYLSNLPDLNAWPEIAKPMLTLHKIFVEYVYITISMISLVILWIKQYSLKSPPGGHRVFFDVLPPWSVQKRIQASVFMTSLGVMLQQGNTLRQSLQRLIHVSPVYLATYQQQMLERLQANMPAAEVLHSEIFDVDTRYYFEDYAEREGLPELLQEEGEDQLNAMAKNIENLAIVVGTLFIMLSLGLNMYIAFSGFALNQAMLDYYQ